LLVVVNKAADSRVIDMPMEDTVLAGCTQFTSEAPATGPAPVVHDGQVHIEEPAESMSVYEVR
jgi:hypothetical protein